MLKERKEGKLQLTDKNINHWRDLNETVVRGVPAGIEHVGHEGDGVDTAGRVHHIDDDAGKRRCLKGKTNRLQERTPGGN